LSYEIRFTRQALKHLQRCKAAHLGEKVKGLLDIIRENPFQNPPPVEKLKGLEEVYSRRLNIQHRLVYQVDKENRHIKILSIWTHYE